MGIPKLQVFIEQPSMKGNDPKTSREIFSTSKDVYIRNHNEMGRRCQRCGIIKIHIPRKVTTNGRIITIIEVLHME